MNEALPHILLLEPYYGGSHRSFLAGLQKYTPFRYTLVSLPARKWKMRMQLAAPWMVEEIIRLVSQGNTFDAILCSTFIDTATLRALLAKQGINLPIAIYFHENQFAYPNQIEDPAIFQFTALNFTSALAADSLAFNSKFNRNSFLQGVDTYLKKAADMDILHASEMLQQKSVVLHPGIDFSGLVAPERKTANSPPVIVWNHRWEHDKDPETFFHTLERLSLEGKEFKLIVLGQHFERCPEIFTEAEKKLKNHVIHFGFAPDRKEYLRLLCQGDIVVSTAIHEFFGMAVLEAVRCGCRPVVPDRLSYQELFPAEFRYQDAEFSRIISQLLGRPDRLPGKVIEQLTEPYSWVNIAARYEEWVWLLLTGKVPKC